MNQRFRSLLLCVLVALALSATIPALVASAARIRSLGVSRTSVPNAWTKLFGMSPVLEFESFDSATGEVIEKTAPLMYEAQGQGLSTIDTTGGGIFYIIGTNLTNLDIALVGISCGSGEVLSETSLPFEVEAFVGIGQYASYDPNLGEVLCIGRDKLLRNQHAVLRVNPQTGNIRVVSRVGDFINLEVLGGTSVYDAGQDIEWIMLAQNNSGPIYVKFYGYSGRTGQLMNLIDNPFGMNTMAYDPISQRIYGFGIRVTPSGTYMRTLVYLDSKTASFGQVADIPNYLNLLSSVTAIDPKDRIVYGLMANTTGAVDANGVGEFDNFEYPRPGPNGELPWEYLTTGMVRGDRNPNSPHNKAPNMDFHLVGINIDTGKIVSDPFACNISTCPWNLQGMP